MLNNDAINAILNAKDADERLEAFTEALLHEANNDEKHWKCKGRQILLALQNNNANDLLLALCGWSVEDLAKRAMLIQDDETFHDSPVECEMTVWYGDDVEECTSDCLVDPQTQEVYDFDPAIFAHADRTIQAVTVQVYPVNDPHTFTCIEATEMPKDETVFWYKPIKKRK